MKVQFVLPPNYNQPVGGYKVVFQYANWLSSKGHEVHIYFMNLKEFFGKKQIRWIKRLLARQNNPTNKITWYPIDTTVSIHYNASPKEIEQLHDGVLIATFWKTAISVLKSNVSLQNKYYFIQDYEIFATSEKNVIKTWHYPLKKIVVSKWLEEKANQLGEYAELIPNFIDRADFYEINENIAYPTVSMLWHDNPRKGSVVGLDILKKIKKEIPDLHAIFFGKNTPPDNLPNWIEYYQNAGVKELRDEIYGKSNVYLMPSEFEGWGLTAMEAMAVGTPVISFENGGIRNFADEQSAILIPVGDISTMEIQLKQLLYDKEKRIRIKGSAVDKLKEYTMTSSGCQFEKIISKR